MKDFKACKICDEYHLIRNPCNPVFKVYHSAVLADGFQEIRAISFEDAAIKYGEFYIAEGGDLKSQYIEVKVLKDGEGYFFHVSVDPTESGHTRIKEN